MSIDKNVVSLDLAKQLVEVGITDKSKFIFCWAEVCTGEKDEIGSYKWEYRVIKDDFQALNERIPAPLASELGEVLPLYLKEDAARGVSFSVEADGLWMHKTYDNRGWVVGYGARSESAATIPNAMAKLLIYLKKEGLI